MERLIESFRDLDTSRKLVCVVGGVAVTLASTIIVRKLLHKDGKVVYPRDTVILHQVYRGFYAPSMSPFAVKLETYLRMARIPYQNVHSFAPSSKGKWPWIEFNGEAVADSTLCIDFLNKKLDIDLNKHLSPAERGIARSMEVMVDEHLFWVLVFYRFVHKTGTELKRKVYNLSRFIWWMAEKRIAKMVWAQGLGRHTQGEIIQFMKKDLQAVSDFLGDQKFLFGDEPCETDCTVFGQLSQFYWQFIGTGQDTIIKDQYPNLASYCERMKTTFWPDWDHCITHGGTREATK